MSTFIWLIAAFTSLIILRFLFSGYLLAASTLLTGSTKSGKVAYAIFFFPGVMIHELSHFFAAAALGVPTGEIEIFPREMFGGVRLGSVKVAKTDIIRNALIGSAPLLVGSTVLFSLLKVRFPLIFESASVEAVSEIFSTQKDWIDLLFLYLLFAVSNTMVLSKSDREGLLPTLLFTGAILITTAVVSRSAVNQEIIERTVTKVFSSLATTFSLVALVNGIFLLPFVIAVKVLEKVRRKRIRFKPSA